MSLDPIIIAITKRRRRNGISREDVADIAGMSLKTYARIERGETDIHLSQYRAILRALNATDLDISLDILDIVDISDKDVLSAARLLSSNSRKLLVKLLLSISN